MKLTRRSMLAALPLLAVARPVSGRKQNIPIAIRPAAPRDISAIVALQLDDAHYRARLDGQLWAVHADAPGRIASSLTGIGQTPSGPIAHHWLVAERGGAVVAVAHGINLPVPPIYDAPGTAGVLLDDSHYTADPEIAALLLRRMEHVLRAAGASVMAVTVPVRWEWRVSFFTNGGYEPTTLYMAKAGLTAGQAPGTVRTATEADVPGIVELSAVHRSRLQEANPAFWRTHPEADARFAKCMSISFDLADRDMFVAGSPESLTGYVIAQPLTSLHIPPAHDIARVGLIDDFYAAAFMQDETTGAELVPHDLLSAAERALHRRGADIALAVCPVRMQPKRRLQTAAGFTETNLWMVKAG